jgi:hypothetical protein
VLIPDRSDSATGTRRILSGQSLFPAALPIGLGSCFTRHQRGFKQFARPVFPSPAAARMERAATWAFPWASHPADQEPDSARQGGDRPPEHGPGTTAQLTSVDLQSSSSLVVCDLASHVAKHASARGDRGRQKRASAKSPGRGWTVILPTMATRLRKRLFAVSVRFDQWMRRPHRWLDRFFDFFELGLDEHERRRPSARLAMQASEGAVLH